MKEVPKDMIVEAAKGDMASFEQIYKTYDDYVFNIALRVTRNREDAGEVLQEVFFKVYHQLPSFRFEADFKTWIYRITMNTAMNHVRKERRRKNSSVPYDDAAGQARPENSVHENIEKEYQKSLVDKALGALTPDQRACVVLKSIEGLKYHEIAECLGIDINAVRSRIKRAREKLMALKGEMMTDEL